MRSSIILLYTELLIYITKATVCYDDGSTFVKDDNFVDIKLSAGRIDTRTGIARYTKCETICKRYDHCVSYFYNSQTRVCELNSISYMSTEGKEESTGTVYYRKLIECPVPPTISNAVEHFDRNTVARSEGSELEYQCIADYLPEPEGLVTCQVTGQWTAKECLKTCPTPTDVNIKQDPITPGPFVVGDILTMACVGAYIAIDLKNKITCQADGTWTSMGCNRIKTCADVKLCSSSYGDANYWMYPPAYGSQRVKIYCHHLSGTPSEFVSLTHFNIGVFPRLTNMECNGEKAEACGPDALIGKTRYSKIKVSATTMVVDRNDSTFGDTVFGATQKYGEANDCYSIHYGNTRASCGPKGTFNIDLSYTGLIVDPNLEFEYFGWNYWGEAVRSAANVKINLLCGGWPGGCCPIGDMRLLFDAAHVPSEGAATVPKCVYP